MQSERRTKLYLFRHYFNFVAYFFGPFIWGVLRDKGSREIPAGMWKSAPARQTPTILPEQAYEKKQLFKLRFTQIGFYVYSFHPPTPTPLLLFLFYFIPRRFLFLVSVLCAILENLPPTFSLWPLVHNVNVCGSEKKNAHPILPCVKNRLFLFLRRICGSLIFITHLLFTLHTYIFINQK